MEVYKVNLPWPDLGSVVVSAMGLTQEDVHVFPHGDCGVVFEGYPCIDEGYKMGLIIFHDFIEFSVAVGDRVDGEDHFLIHIVQIRPKDIDRQVVLFKLLQHLLQLSSRLIAPTTLMVPHAPKRRNVTRPNVLMVSLQNRLRVRLTDQHQKVHLPSNYMEQQLLTIFGRLHQHPKSIFEVE